MVLDWSALNLSVLYLFTCSWFRASDPVCKFIQTNENIQIFQNRKRAQELGQLHQKSHILEWDCRDLVLLWPNSNRAGSCIFLFLDIYGPHKLTRRNLELARRVQRLTSTPHIFDLCLLLHSNYNHSRLWWHSGLLSIRTYFLYFADALRRNIFFLCYRFPVYYSFWTQ